eukprot:1975011-Amphidinium_carterae.4
MLWCFVRLPLSSKRASDAIVEVTTTRSKGIKHSALLCATQCVDTQDKRLPASSRRRGSKTSGRS